jgi:Ca2+-binding EF-hand superfamily protein
MTRNMMIGAALAALLATAGGVAIAQSAGQGMMRGGDMMEGAGRMGDGPMMGGPMMGGPGMRGEGMMVMFAEIDADGDGRVTLEEIEAHRAARFATLDADGNGTVSRQEFMDHAAAMAGERAGLVFDRFDVDGDGTLTRDAIEARRGMGPDISRMFARFDADGDGAVTVEEIEAVQERMMERRGDGGRMGRWGGGRDGQGRGHGWRHGN